MPKIRTPTAKTMQIISERLDAISLTRKKTHQKPLLNRLNQVIIVKRIEAYIQVGKLEAVQDGLFGAGVQGMSVVQVRGYGRQMGNTTGEKSKSPALLPKLKIEVFVSDSKLDTAVQAIIRAAKTGEIGDGKIFISDIEDAIRVRTGESGDIALD